MNKEVYNRFFEKELILRDYLAVDRTAMANERTFLGYIRTALTLLISGATFIRFFEVILFVIIGWVFIPASFVVLFIGIKRYRSVKRTINAIIEARKTPKEPLEDVPGVQ